MNFFRLYEKWIFLNTIFNCFGNTFQCLNMVVDVYFRRVFLDELPVSSYEQVCMLFGNAYNAI